MTGLSHLCFPVTRLYVLEIRNAAVDVGIRDRVRLGKVAVSLENNGRVLDLMRLVLIRKRRAGTEKLDYGTFVSKSFVI